MKPAEPIFVTDVYAQLHDELMALLTSLSGDDWYKPTAAGQWQVRDIVAHLLDSDIRRLSFQRDQAPQVPPDKPINSYRDLVDFLNQLNADWVKAARRISPQLLIEFHAITGPLVAALFRSLDPFGPALFGVAWAGEEGSLNWFDIAREYTEKWHHQQQIRDAVGALALYDRKWLYPVLDTFLRGLPHTYRDVAANEGTQIVFRVTGDAGGEWTLARESDAWELYSGSVDAAACTVQMDCDTAWRLLTKGLSRTEAVARIELIGEQELGKPILGMLAIMG
ncbi:MAG: maleylpyruvate isomerase N-terminal domain-containing protein [Blastocatellia bacterium]